MLTRCAYNRLFNKLTNLRKLQAVYDMQLGMAVEQVMIVTGQPACHKAGRRPG